MSNTNWLTQENSKPLFKDLIWSKPESKIHAKKVLLIGGSSHGFSKTYKYFVGCEQAGVGEVKLVIPSSLSKITNHPMVVFGDSNKDGSFSKKSFSQICSYSEWADSVWLTGEFGNNSNTLMFLDEVMSLNKRKIFSGDVSAHIKELSVLKADLLLILNFSEYQRIASKIFGLAPTHRMDLSIIVDTLQRLTSQCGTSVAVEFDKYCLVGNRGKVVTQKRILDYQTASRIATYWTQFPGKPLQAIACGLIDYLAE